MLSRLLDSGAVGGSVLGFDMTAISHSQRLVTPVRRPDNSLNLIGWHVGPTGAIDLLGESGPHSPITNVAVPPRSDPAHIVTVSRGMDGRLSIGKSRILDAGGFVVEISSQLGEMVSAVGSSADSLVVATAERTPLGDLQVRSWNSSLGETGTAKAGGITALGRPYFSGNLLVTPVTTDCRETMRLIAWQLSKGGELEQIADSGDQGGVATRVAIARIGEYFVTASRSGNDDPFTLAPGAPPNGELRVMFWQINGEGINLASDSGATGVPIADVDVAGVSFNEVSLDPSIPVAYRVATAVRTADGFLRLLTWSFDVDAGTVTMADDAGVQPEPISRLRLLNVSPSRFVAAVRDDASQHLPADHACLPIEEAIAKALDEMQKLQEQLQHAPVVKKHAIGQGINKLNLQLKKLRGKLEECEDANAFRPGHLKLISWEIS